MNVLPEDAHAYAETLHEDLRALTLAVERVALALEASASGETPFHVRQRGVVATRKAEDVPF